MKIPDLAFMHSETVELEIDNLMTFRQLSILVEDIEELMLWWPNGHGEQNLFKMTIEISIGAETIAKSETIGFRSVALIQNPIKDSKQDGLTFFFEINNVPIFLKGV